MQNLNERTRTLIAQFLAKYAHVQSQFTPDITSIAHAAVYYMHVDDEQDVLVSVHEAAHWATLSDYDRSILGVNYVGTQALADLQYIVNVADFYTDAINVYNYIYKQLNIAA